MALSERIEYCVVDENMYSEELGEYRSFGIEGKDVLGNTVVFCSDVSLDKSLVAELCGRCNELCLSPLHLLDVIEDSL